MQYVSNCWKIKTEYEDVTEDITLLIAEVWLLLFYAAPSTGWAKKSEPQMLYT